MVETQRLSFGLAEAQQSREGCMSRSKPNRERRWMPFIMKRLRLGRRVKANREYAGGMRRIGMQPLYLILMATPSKAVCHIPGIDPQ